jgi:hypothetical protein
MRLALCSTVNDLFYLAAVDLEFAGCARWLRPAPCQSAYRLLQTRRRCDPRLVLRCGNLARAGSPASGRVRVDGALISADQGHEELEGTGQGEGGPCADRGEGGPCADQGEGGPCADQGADGAIAIKPTH